MWGARATVRDLLSRASFDLVHVHFVFPDGLIALLEAAPRGVPFVITAHGSDVPGYNRKWFFRLAHWVLRPIWRRVARSAAAIISPSRTLARLIEFARPGTKVDLIPNGISPDRFYPAQKKEQMLVATRLVKRKGVQYLLEALARSECRWPAIIVGSGEYEAKLRQLNTALGHPATLVGWLPNDSEEFRDLLQRSAIFLLPSDFENFPMSLLEAMAAGCAIVTTKGHGCEEVVGDAAELVTSGAVDAKVCVNEIDAALERLTNDSVHLRELGNRARKRLDDSFAWRSIARSYVGIYEDAVQRPTPEGEGLIES